MKPLCQYLRIAVTPVVQEIIGRRLANHVIMQGNNMDTGVAQSVHNRLNLTSSHGEIPIDDRMILIARECCPGRQSH